MSSKILLEEKPKEEEKEEEEKQEVPPQIAPPNQDTDAPANGMP